MSTRFVITGFGQFAGVQNNPTQQLVEWLAAQQQQHAKHKATCTSLAITCSQGGVTASNEGVNTLPSRSSSTLAAEAGGFEIVSCKVLEVSGQAVSSFLKEQQTLLTDLCSDPSQPLVLLHLGVDTEGTCLKLESQAYNNAHFRCPDQAGWQPSNALIEQAEGLSLNSTRVTPLPLQHIARKLRSAGFNCQVSEDAGRFVCNYTYYKSLALADSICSATGSRSRVVSMQSETNMEAKAAAAANSGQDCESSCSCRSSLAELDSSHHSSTRQQQQNRLHSNQQATTACSTGACKILFNSCYSLFVHVPPFKVVPRMQQQEFLQMLLQCIDAELRSNLQINTQCDCSEF